MTVDTGAAPREGTCHADKCRYCDRELEPTDRDDICSRCLRSLLTSVATDA